MPTILSRSAAFLAAAATLALAPLQAHAQSAEHTGFFLGVGAGASRIAEPGAHAARLAPSLHLRAGWSFSPAASLMLEGALNGIGSPNPDAPPFDEGIGGTYRNRQLATQSVLASLQLGSARSVYVRPGIGVARHSFTAFRPLPADGYAAETSHEWGAAAGLAVGHELAIPGFPLRAEAVGQWSHGEDSSSPRWSAGVQFVRVIGF